MYISLRRRSLSLVVSEVDALIGWGKLLVSLWEKEKTTRVPSEDEQPMHHTQLEINPCIYVTVCSLGLTRQRGFLFGK